MKENPFGNMVQTATSFVSRLRTKPQVSMGARMRPQEKAWLCMVQHVNVAWAAAAWPAQAGGRGRAFPDGWWLLDKLS